ncbi:unnamed protein product [Pleuronectes platessa]|uniref:Uncharacterized protein n=1 Tax=Pleuronectes platessa TaxID=8262 RepID=A0A9N7YL34_PLEPL|nr:unnamed protein product [Pleuronectes platessa]
MLRAHEGGPRGSCHPHPPHPLTPSPLNWGPGCTKGLALPPLTTPKNVSRLPLHSLPSCSGQCPNARTSHLGLAKPVPTVGGGAPLPCLAPVLAALRTLPCIRKHAGVGRESRSGLENDVAVLPRPDFLLSLALWRLSPEGHRQESPIMLIQTNL